MFNVLKSKPIHVCFFGDADQKHVTALSSLLCSKCLPFMDMRLNPKRKNTFWDQVHMLAGSMHYEAGSTYPGHLSVIGALLLWHEAGCQLQTPFKRVSMCEIDVNEELSLNRLKHRPVKSNNLQQPVIPTFIHKEIDVGNIRFPRATAGCHGRLTISGIFQKWWCYFP